MIINIDLNSLFLFLVIGVAAGFVANSLMGKRGASLLSSLILGLAGAFVGGIILPALGLRAWGLIGNFIAAVIGSIVILIIAQALNGRPYRRH